MAAPELSPAQQERNPDPTAMSAFWEDVARKWPAAYQFLAEAAGPDSVPRFPGLDVVVEELDSTLKRELTTFFGLVETGLAQVHTELSKNEATIAEYETIVTAMQCANQETITDNESRVAALQAINEAIISGYENRVAGLQAANEALQQTNRNNPAYSAHVPRPETSTLATFTGDEKNTEKREAAFEIWVVQIRLHLLRHADYYNTPLKQLTMILDHVKGPALESILPGIDVLLTHPTDPTTWQWTTAEELLAKLAMELMTLPANANRRADSQVRPLCRFRMGIGHGQWPY